MRNIVFGIAFFSVLLGLRTAQAKYSGGTGQLNNPYRIATPNDFNDIGNHVEDFNSHFVMVSDINLASYSGTQFNVIGQTYEQPFTGVFDGNSHAIANFNSVSSEAGLFGFVSDPNTEIKNLRLVNPYVVGGAAALAFALLEAKVTDCHVEDGYVPGYSGFVVDNEGIIRNCSFTGTVAGSSGGLVWTNDGTIEDCIVHCYMEAVGGAGLVVYNEGVIRRCATSGTIEVGDRIAGLAVKNGGLIEECHSSMDVRGIGMSTHYEAGLIVENWGTVRSCYSTGSVHGYSFIGGLISTNHAGTIEDCYSSSKIWGAAGVSGGLIAINYSGTVSNSFWDVETSGEPNSAGEPNAVGLPTSEMQTRSTFEGAGWDFNDVWAICEGTNYPRHIWSIPAADFVCPDGVNFIDYSYFAPQWLASDCNEANSYCSGRDLNESGLINEEDLKIFCSCWLDGI